MANFNSDAKIALTGGAGYIGSFTVKYLQSLGLNNLVILDNFSTGHKDTCYARSYDVDLMDKEKLEEIFQKEKFDAVIHFAALIVVPESMEQPYRYFNHNLNTSLNLLEAMRKSGTQNIVFSSTCTVCGTPDVLPINEQESIKPANVYAETKAMIEKMIKWFSEIYGMHYAILRYFNASGAAPDGSHGEDHTPETHLIPSAIRSILAGNPIQLYGSDYPTKDGTGVRDYVHVDDLASAHHLALKYIIENNVSDTFNLGTGNGVTSLEMVNAIVEEAKKRGIEAKYEIKPRRAGDAVALYADNKKAKSILGWEPKYTDIREIVAQAFEWHTKAGKK